MTIATDAVTDTRQVSHDYALQHLFPRLGETGTTAELLALLDKA